MGVAVARDRYAGVVSIIAYHADMTRGQRIMVAVATGVMVVGVAVGGTAAWVSVALWMAVGCYCGTVARSRHDDQ